MAKIKIYVKKDFKCGDGIRILGVDCFMECVCLHGRCGWLDTYTLAVVFTCGQAILLKFSEDEFENSKKFAVALAKKLLKEDWFDMLVVANIEDKVDLDSIMSGKVPSDMELIEVEV